MTIKVSLGETNLRFTVGNRFLHQPSHLLTVLIILPHVGPQPTSLTKNSHKKTIRHNMQSVSNMEQPSRSRRASKRSLMYRVSVEPTMTKEFTFRTTSDSMLSARRSLKRNRVMVEILPICFEENTTKDPFALEKCCAQNASPPRRRGSREIDLAAIATTSVCQ